VTVRDRTQAERTLSYVAAWTRVKSGSYLKSQFATSNINRRHRFWKRRGAQARVDVCASETAQLRCRHTQGEAHSLTHTITLIPGDGTGPEIVEATRRAIEATGVKIEWDVHEIGMSAMAKYGTPFPNDALESVRRNRVALKGPLTTELGTGFRSVNVALRKEFDLYANLRPAKTYPGVPSPRGDIDLVVVRENIEDLYAGIEFDVDSPEEREVQETIERLAKTKIREHSALAIKAISVFGSRRIVKFAFDYARANRRKKVTAVHKANIIRRRSLPAGRRRGREGLPRDRVRRPDR